ncbi:MAG: PAS domain S-box protein [Bacteroidetes bacterium]|jgi:PAS domain S-box-containing protein|nr:PAS domain S-box protein [Bacteroidota bacterium]
MDAPLQILSLEDDATDFDLICHTLRREGLVFDVVRVQTERELLTALEERRFDIILSDYSLPSYNGIAALQAVRGRFPDLPFVFVSGALGEEVAISSLRTGATDYVLKDKLTRLGPAVRRAIEETRHRLAGRQAQEALAESEDRYRRLVEHSADLVAELDAAGIVQYASPNFRLLLGVDPSSLVGTPIGKGFHADDQAALRTELQGSRPRGEFRYRDGSGNWHWLELSGQRFHNRTSIERVVLVARDVTQRKEDERELASQRRQLQLFAERLEREREAERMRISREIHDELGQMLTVLKFDLSWLKLNHAQGGPAVDERLDQVLESLQESLGSVKRIARELRPPQLDALGLGGALQYDVTQFTKKLGIRALVTIDPPEIALERDLALALYRVFQEALTNIARHAHARFIEVELRMDDGMIRLRVRDDGRGINTAELQGSTSLGLVGMRERVRPWNGRITITGRKNHGTTVVVEMPVSAAPQGASPS